MTWIGTNRGHKIDLLDPDPSEIDPLDIADGLARTARFAGMTSDAYSVAQHSVEASHYCIAHPLAALLHDASEAYICDLPRPLKILIPEYKLIETRLMRAIGERFGVYLEVLPPAVKHVDDLLLATEKRDLQPHGPEWDGIDLPEPLRGRLKPWCEEEASEKFLDRLHELTQL